MERRVLDILPRKRRWFVAAIGTVVLALSGCGIAHEVHHVSHATSFELAQPEGLTDPSLQKRAAQIMSTFENSTTTVQYAYAENIHDGRGITAGRAGFTSATGDLLEVVEQYTKQKPTNSLAQYLPALKADNGTDSTKGLEHFVPDWQTAAKHDSQLRTAQDAVFNNEYLTPALQQAKSAGVRTAVGQLVILDTIVQHGDGSDPDGLPAILNETEKQYGAVHRNEQRWLIDFLEVRKRHLESPADPSTRAAWRESVDRVTALESIVDSGNESLTNAITWTVYGDHYSLPQE